MSNLVSDTRYREEIVRNKSNLMKLWKKCKLTHIYIIQYSYSIDKLRANDYDETCLGRVTKPCLGRVTKLF